LSSLSSCFANNYSPRERGHDFAQSADACGDEFVAVGRD